MAEQPKDQSGESTPAPSSILPHVDLWVKCFAAIAAIAYVSGYLTATTYMGTYGIHVDSDDLFRAKYVYIGFHYCLFIAVLILLATLMRRCFVWFRAASEDDKNPPKLSPEERRRALDSFWDEDLAGKEYRSFRWACIVSVLVAAFSSEIMFVNPPHISRYIPLETIMLFNVLVFQVERYAWLAPYGPYEDGKMYYIWGRLYCERATRWVRNTAAGMVIFAALLMLLHGYVRYFRARFGPAYWLITVFATTIQICCVVFLNLGFDNQRRISRRKTEVGELDNPGQITEDSNVVIETKQERWITRKRWLRLAASVLLTLVVVGSAWSVLGISLTESSPPSFLPAKFVFIGIWYCTPLFVLVVSLNLWQLSRMRQRKNKDREQAASAKAGDASETTARQEKMNLAGSPVQQAESRVLNAALCTVLYVISVLSFSRLIYPHIPEEKAGGDFGGNIKLNLLLKQAPPGACPSHLPNHFLVMEEDASWIYLANADDAGGPRAWRSLTLDSTLPRPRVYAINKDCISMIGSVDPAAGAR